MKVWRKPSSVSSIRRPWSVPKPVVAGNPYPRDKDPRWGVGAGEKPCVRPDQGHQRLVDVLWDGACCRFEQSDVRRRLVWTKIGRFKAQTCVCERVHRLPPNNSGDSTAKPCWRSSSSNHAIGPVASHTGSALGLSRGCEVMACCVERRDWLSGLIRAYSQSCARGVATG